jgi:endonuclease YncB( thermonuclease family)
VVAVLAAIAVPGGVALAETIVGPAEVIDGDTLRIGEERIRLLGIDAPELDQDCAAVTGGTWPCGTAAQLAVIWLASGALVACEWDTRDQYDRALAICWVASTLELNRTLVNRGLAWAYLSDLYIQDEAEARAHGVAIWQAPTMTAAEFRRAHDAAILAGQPQPPDPACTIKGNINAAGDRIYHLPGASGYDETVIRVEQGERWFCTAEEALAAGWRARQ